MQGVPAALSEGETMTVVFAQERIQGGCAGGCAGRGAQGCPSEQGPCAPGAVCWGRDSASAGLSTQPARGAPHGVWGEAVGGRRDPHQGWVLLLLRGCCVGQGCSQLHVTTGKLPRGCFKRKVKAGFAIEIKRFPESLFLLSYSEGRDLTRVGRKREIKKGAVKLGQVLETPEL